MQRLTTVSFDKKTKTIRVEEVANEVWYNHITKEVASTMPKYGQSWKDRFWLSYDHRITEAADDAMFEKYNVVAEDFDYNISGGGVYGFGSDPCTPMHQFTLMKLGFSENLVKRGSNIYSNSEAKQIFRYFFFPVQSPNKVEAALKEMTLKFKEHGELRSMPAFMFQDLMQCRNGKELFRLMYTELMHPEAYVALNHTYLVHHVTWRSLLDRTYEKSMEVIEAHTEQQQQLLELTYK